MHVELASPLDWPIWVPRHPGERSYSRFETSRYRAQKDLEHEFRLLGASEVIIASDLVLNRDGRPSAKQPRVIDPGVAVYYTLHGTESVMACDRWRLLEENLKAIAKTVEALRGIERWGTEQMRETAFRGYAVLPASTGGGWWSVLEVAPDASREAIEAAHRRLVKVWHPDMPGGDTERFQMIRDAYRQGLAASDGR